MVIHDGISTPVLSHPQDPEETVKYSIVFLPDPWSADTVYYTSESVVLPPQFNGFYYQAMSGGISGSRAPTFPQKAGEKVSDGGVEWVAIPYNFFMSPGDRLNSVAWLSDTPEVVFSGEAISGGVASVLVSGIPDSVPQVKITARASIGQESIDRSFIIPVRSL